MLKRSFMLAAGVAMLVCLNSASPTFSAPTTQPATQPLKSPQLGIVLMDSSKYGWTQDQIRDYGGNLVVNEVKPDSRAEKMGMKLGDVIKKIDGREMKVVPDVIKAVQDGAVLKIEVVRDHQTVTLEETIAGK